MLKVNKAVLIGIPVPYQQLSRAEKDYQHRLKQMSDNLKLEALHNNLNKGYHA